MHLQIHRRSTYPLPSTITGMYTTQHTHSLYRGPYAPPPNAQRPRSRCSRSRSRS